MNNEYNLTIIINNYRAPDFLWILEYNMMTTRTLVTIINTSIITLKLVAIMIVVLLSAISDGVTVGSPVVLVTINEQKLNKLMTISKRNICNINFKYIIQTC